MGNETALQALSALWICSIIELGRGRYEGFLSQVIALQSSTSLQLIHAQPKLWRQGRRTEPLSHLCQEGDGWGCLSCCYVWFAWRHPLHLPKSGEHHSCTTVLKSPRFQWFWTCEISILFSSFSIDLYNLSVLRSPSRLSRIQNAQSTPRTFSCCTQEAHCCCFCKEIITETGRLDNSNHNWKLYLEGLLGLCHTKLLGYSLYPLWRWCWCGVPRKSDATIWWNSRLQPSQK